MDNTIKASSKVTPALLRIANTILCNYSMVGSNNLVNGKMGVCLFLYEYARLTGIKEYEDIADDMVDPLLKTLHDGKNEENISCLSGIGIGVIYLITHQFLEDTDEHDSLEAVDKLLLKTIEEANTASEMLIPPVLYLIYRHEHYRDGLDLRYSHKLVRHIIDLFKCEKDEKGEPIILSSFILQHAAYLLAAYQGNEEILNNLRPLSLEILQEKSEGHVVAKDLWYNFLFSWNVSQKTISDELIYSACQYCFYDAERAIGVLCSFGLGLMNNMKCIKLRKDKYDMNEMCEAFQ